MKFLADMGISPRTVEFLRGVGHEAVHLHEQGLDKLSDFEILSKARREASCVLTSDLDFSELVAVGGHQLPSVIVFRLRDMRPDSVNQHLKAILDQYIGALEEGAIVSVTERHFRVRSLPV